jgi:hypothetical protein
MEIIKDIKTLNAISKKQNLKYDKKYRYITDYNFLRTTFLHNNKKYKIKYFDGCFNPYLITY